ncbi:diacylglycerol kinase family protein [Actinokineospora sp. NBRC 105648]|uniref:diacylglycerol/lipid kinase family protein n=1 Tax=Actinokineospora sp. NBRC 105648 TaxID=3032206 RepID=UPI0024A5F7A7|nr:diacylglycerol kinase family protein [Actinokineospora sp. NBRC 105648]GLZ42487.1 diacylglycerol kinase [Actinokineospora sp. NBRC 105648]
MTGPQPSQAPTRVLVIANPTAGSATSALLAGVRDQCGAFAPTTLHITTARGEATESVQRALAEVHPPDLVVVIGGDGTVREVVEGLVGTSTANLMIIPGGTGNSAYRMLWADKSWSDALASVFAGTAEPRRLDLARIEETRALVFLGACSGVVAEALVHAKQTVLTGRARYAQALSDAAAAFEPYPGQVIVDGKVLFEGRTILANVGGGRYRGGQYLLLPLSELGDGLLDVVVVSAQVPVQRVPDLVRNGDHLGEPGVFYGRGSRIEVLRTDGQALVFEHDGELQQDVANGMSLQVLSGALRVWCDPAVVPPSTQRELW